VLGLTVLNGDTARRSRHILLDEMLAAVVEALRVQPASPFTRDFVAEAERYQRVIAGWAHSRPTDSECAAMYDCVLELRAKASARIKPPFAPRVTPVEVVVPTGKPPAPK
jgi:hypothetical protein